MTKRRKKFVKGKAVKRVVSKKQAVKIAIQYVTRQRAKDWTVNDDIGTISGYMYEPSRYRDCWVVHPPSNGMMVGASRVILVHKKTGKIIFDGSVGE